MTTIKELLGQGDIEKPKRNFLQENVRKLREMKPEKTNKVNSQRNKNFQPLSERRNTQTVNKSSHNQKIQSAVSRLPGNSFPPSNRHSAVRKVKPIVLAAQDTPSTVDVTPKGYRSQGCQTLNCKQLETLYHEGIIRYPSARPNKVQKEELSRDVSVREMGLQTEEDVETLHPPPDDTGLHLDEEKDDRNETRGEKDFVKMNATVPDPRLRTAENLQFDKTDPTRAPPCYQRGVLPKYLKDQKKELEREKVTKAREEAADCPDGHVLLPEDIRVKHLFTLKENYKDLVCQLNQLPISTYTLRTRTRKKQIETDLDRIEAAISLFSREKVFVKADS